MDDREKMNLWTILVVVFIVFIWVFIALGWHGARAITFGLWGSSAFIWLIYFLRVLRSNGRTR